MLGWLAQREDLWKTSGWRRHQGSLGMWVGRLQLGKPLLDQSLNVGTSARAVHKPTVPQSFRNAETHRGHYAVHVIMLR